MRRETVGYRDAPHLICRRVAYFNMKKLFLVRKISLIKKNRFLFRSLDVWAGNDGFGRGHWGSRRPKTRTTTSLGRLEKRRATRRRLSLCWQATFSRSMPSKFYSGVTDACSGVFLCWFRRRWRSCCWDIVKQTKSTCLQTVKCSLTDCYL